jgi:YesN/AraC family two-component response regulator
MKAKYTVVIAEDEMLILKNLVSMVEQECDDFEVIAKAVNGKDAIGYVEDLRPHILITDIRMPGADGIEILKFIYENHLQTISIIVSSFDQFNYAREALHYGAREYLLKPVTPVQLKSTLGEIKSLLDSRNTAAGVFSLDMALSGMVHTLPGNFSVYLLFMIHYGNFNFLSDEHIDDPLVPDMDGFTAAMHDLCGDGEETWLSTRHKNRYWYGLLGSAEMSRVHEFIMKLHEVMEIKNREMPVSILAEAVTPRGNLGNIAENLLQQMRHNGIFGKSICLSGGKTASGASMQELFNECAIYGEKLIRALQSRNIPSLSLILSDMVWYWKGKNCPAEILLNIIKYQYLSASKELRAMLRLDWEDSFARVFSVSSSWEELHKELLVLFTGLFSDQETMRHAEDMMKMIDKYICDYYAGHITNQTLSKHFGFVPSYISKLFREYKGMSPGEYLTRVRIAKAIELISHANNVNVYDIAREVGFSDPSYFSRLFKQQTGMLPTEYREFSRHSGLPGAKAYKDV